jgi:hypothetical protein
VEKVLAQEVSKLDFDSFYSQSQKVKQEKSHPKVA